MYSIGLTQGGKVWSMFADLYLYSYGSTTWCNNFFFYRYIDDIIVFYLNSNNSLDLPASYPIYLNLSEVYFVSNASIFFDIKNILNSFQSLDIDQCDKRKYFLFYVSIFTKFSSYLH